MKSHMRDPLRSHFFNTRVDFLCLLAVQVGAELLYIAQAPKLALNDKDFVEFPDVSRITEPYDRKVRGQVIVVGKLPSLVSSGARCLVGVHGLLQRKAL